MHDSRSEDRRPLHLAMLGTRGVPARYGGFETAVERIGERLVARGHQVTVYARNPGQRDRRYRGMRVVNLPAVRTRTTETLSHAVLSTAHTLLADRPDAVFVFNAANAPVIPVLRAAGLPVIVNVDGLESDRAKWRGLGSRYFAWAQAAAVRWADAVIADSRAIQVRIEAAYGRATHYISYGCDPATPDTDRLRAAGLSGGEYTLVVARFEPENHVDVIVRAYRAVPGQRPLVIVGDTPYSRDFRQRVHDLAEQDDRVRLLGTIYDQPWLSALFAGARLHVHGHSVGGTNPSLLRAAVAAPVLAYDCPFNREVLGDLAVGYWRGEDDLAARLTTALAGERAAPAGDRIAARYCWDDVATAYLALAEGLITGRVAPAPGGVEPAAAPVAPRGVEPAAAADPRTADESRRP